MNTNVNGAQQPTEKERLLILALNILQTVPPSDDTKALRETAARQLNEFLTAGEAHEKAWATTR